MFPITYAVNSGYIGPEKIPKQHHVFALETDHVTINAKLKMLILVGKYCITAKNLGTPCYI
jgi:hypothetical protein